MIVYDGVILVGVTILLVLLMVLSICCFIIGGVAILYGILGLAISIIELSVFIKWRLYNAANQTLRHMW